MNSKLGTDSLFQSIRCFTQIITIIKFVNLGASKFVQLIFRFLILAQFWFKLITHAIVIVGVREF